LRRNASLITEETAWYYSVLRGKIVYLIIIMHKNRSLKIKHSRRTGRLTFSVMGTLRDVERHLEYRAVFIFRLGD